MLTAEDGPLQPTSKISYPSLAVGLPNSILCFEMAIISIIHLRAYPYQPYKNAVPGPKGTQPCSQCEDLHYLEPRGESVVNSDMNIVHSNRVSPSFDDVESHCMTLKQAFVHALSLHDLWLSLTNAIQWIGNSPKRLPNNIERSNPDSPVYTIAEAIQLLRRRL